MAWSASSSADDPCQTTWPALDDGVPVGQRNQFLDVLVDHQHALPFAAQAGEAGPYLLADQWGEPFGGLVENQQARVGDQRPADRQHLLFAAGKLAAEVLRAFAQAREQVVDAGRRPRRPHTPAVGVEGDQMLVDGEIGEALPAFRNQRDAGAADAVRPPAGDVLAGKANAAGPDRLQTADGAQGRRLAHAVAAEQGRRLPLGHGETEAKQHLAGAVGDLEAGNFEQGAHRWSPR